jgi:L-ascorbate metabolism protein UlaG (beta-lactamase superfamily)
LLIALEIIALIVIMGYLVVKYYPAFGGKPSKEKRLLISQSANYSKGKFLNQTPTSMEMKLTETLKVLFDFIKGHPESKPKQAITVMPFNALNLQENKHATVKWLGHSAILLQLDGKILFIDPMLGRAPSPFPIIGGKRYSEKLPIEIDELPSIDAVLISHDHYDHLDYGSIMKLKAKVKQFFVPLGVAAHLERWGVEEARIKEVDWWDEFEYEGITLASAPARHFSGRSMGDRNSTLWCSWIIKGQQASVFFSGDSGYGPHFNEIGNKYGPFDLTLMECGQYDERWSAIHMMPEETVQAHLDVKGKLMIPIHWGAFTLSLHGWTDPVERATRAAEQQNAAIATPRIGETVTIGSSEYPNLVWWR